MARRTEQPLVWMWIVGVVLATLAGCGRGETSGPRVIEQRWPSGELRTRRTMVPKADGTWVEQGLVESFYEDGTLRSRGMWEQGRKHGLFEYWHANGQKRAEVVNRQGVAHGRVRIWDERGKLLRDEMWNAGKQSDSRLDDQPGTADLEEADR